MKRYLFIRESDGMEFELTESQIKDRFVWWMKSQRFDYLMYYRRNLVEHFAVLHLGAWMKDPVRLMVDELVEELITNYIEIYYGTLRKAFKFSPCDNRGGINTAPFPRKTQQFNIDDLHDCRYGDSQAVPDRCSNERKEEK